MTAEELQAIKERAERATPGPWLVSAGTGGWWVVGPAGADVNIGCKVGENIKDAAFIARARADVPALLAEVERLQAIVNQLPAPAHCDENHTAGMSAVEERG